MVLRELSQLLGLFREPSAAKVGDDDDKLVGGLVQLLIDLRNEGARPGTSPWAIRFASASRN